MAQTFMRYLNVSTTLTPAPTAGTTSKQVLITGQRITDGDLITATGGYNQPNYYIPFLLPSFPNGQSALSYLSNYGIQSTIGINFTQTLPAPTTVTPNGSITTLSWSSVPTNFLALTGFNLTGALSQLLVNANVISATIISGVAYLTVYGTPAFITASNSGATMTLTGVNNVVYPDPNLTDPIALEVWDFYQSALSANASAFGPPAAYISILSDRDTTVDPSSTPIALAAPASVTAPSGGSQTLTYPTSANNLGYLPTTTFGNTIASQTVALPTNSSNFVYYANGMFIRGSAAGAGLDYSLDGVIWTPSNITSGTFTSAYFHGTLFVATSAVGIYSSSNGMSWTVTNINSGSFNFVTFANTKWVALSTVGIYYSANGTNWTISTGAATGVFNQAAFGAGKWIASCSVDLYSSTDGITWAALTYSTDGFDAVTFADGLFVVGSDGSGTDGLAYSPDGVTFTASNIATNSYSSIAFNNDMWEAASDAGIYYSLNGISWTLASGTSANSYSSVIFANSAWVSTSDAGIYYSTDGIAWAASNIATGTYNSVNFGENLFIAVGTPGIRSSTNGSVWASNNTASGTFEGYEIDGSNVVITLSNLTGTFTNTSSVSIVLDDTINAFDFLDGINLYGCVLQFPINTLNDINVNQAAFFDGTAGLNESNQVLNGHYGTYGMAGNITSLPNNAANLPNANDQNKILVTYPYVYKFGGIPYDNTAGNVASGRITAAVAYMLANGDAPFPPLMTATINHLPVSSVAATTSYSSAPGGTGDLAVNQGWLPLAPNSQGVVQFLESNTTLTTIPDTTTPDIEFRYTHIWDCVRWLRQQVAQLFETISVLPNNQGSQLISPAFLNQFRTGIMGILNQGQSLSVLQNVALYENLVTVVQDSQLPNQVDAYIPCQIIPQLNGANVLINVFSSLITFTNNNQGA